MVQYLRVFIQVVIFIIVLGGSIGLAQTIDLQKEMLKELATQQTSNESAQESKEKSVSEKVSKAVEEEVVENGRKKKFSAEVKLFHKPLFKIKTELNGLSPEDRATIVTENLEELTHSLKKDVKNIDVVNEENLTYIKYKDDILITITQEEALKSGKSRLKLANNRAKIIKKAILKFREGLTLESLSRGGLYALVLTLILFIIFKILGFIQLKIFEYLDKLKEAKIKSLYIQNFQAVSADSILAVVKFFVKLFKNALILVLLYFYLTVVCNFFPWTAEISQTLMGYITSTVVYGLKGFVSFIPNIIMIALIVYVFHNIMKVCNHFFNAVKNEKVKLSWFHKEWTDISSKLVKFFLVVFGIVIVYEYLPGSGSFMFKGVSIFLGFLLTIGSTTLMANIVAGIVLIYTRSFSIGERVKIGDNVGDIYETNLLVTRLKTIKNEIISIPNSKVLGAEVLNYSKLVDSFGLVLHTQVSIGYDVNQAKVERLLIMAAEKTEHIDLEKAPFVLKKSLDDFYITYELNAFTNQPKLMPQIYSQLNENILNVFNENGVEIASPHYYAIRDGNKVTIPED